jgi:hypothetical protein
MLETVIARILAALGAGDQVIAAGGPSATFVLAMLFGVAAAQSLKQIYKDLLSPAVFTALTRTIAIVAPILFAHFLADSLNGAWEVAAGFCSLGFYHLTRMCVRRWWPWLETSPAVGAVDPPASAVLAKAQRTADKAMDGQESGI